MTLQALPFRSDHYPLPIPSHGWDRGFQPRLATSQAPNGRIGSSPCVETWAESTGAARHRIYVVDDEQMIGQTLCLILRMSGYEATAFPSAESALLAIDARRPDLVISDVVLNGAMNGIEFAERLSRTHGTVEVLLMSGLGTFSEAYAAASSRGFTPNVRVKPVPPKLLLEEVKTKLAIAFSRESGIGQLHAPEVTALPS